MPAIIRFLGYNPLPANEWAERLARRRTRLGTTREEAAKLRSVNPGTLARWKRGVRAPAVALLKCVEAQHSSSLRNDKEFQHYHRTSH